MADLDVWVIPAKRQILITAWPGPPVEICGYVSAEAQAAHEARGGFPTVSEIGFPADLYLGSFEDYALARTAADRKAQELGFEVIDDSDDEDYFEDEDDFDDDVEDEDVVDFDEDDLDDEDEWFGEDDDAEF